MYITTAPEKSRYKYAKTLRTLLRALGEQPTPTMDNYITALGIEAQQFAPKHARPLSRAQAIQLIGAEPDAREKLAIWLAWKTASRWDEIFHLSSKSILKGGRDDQLILSWIPTGTKSSRKKRFLLRAMSVVEDCDARRITAAKKIINNLAPGERLTARTTSQMAQRMQKILGTEAEDDLVFGGHSFKQGALREAASIVEEKALKPSLLSLLARHKHSDQLPESTVRYLHNSPNLIAATGLGKLTRHL